MDEPLTLIALAHKMGLNDFKLKKGYKQLYGATLFEDFFHFRMQRARQLLQQTDHSIIAITEMIGYKNVSAFSVAFKKYFGDSPGTFRKLSRA
jgi:YesN/AraC family two-component response regulator